VLRTLKVGFPRHHPRINPCQTIYGWTRTV
jgi:hypothetical protein